MKIFTKLLLLALVAGLAGPFIMKKPDGTPLLNWRDFIPSNPITAVTETIAPKQAAKMYRWKDAKGHWQFSDSPPEDALATEVTVKTPINSMKTIELPEGFKKSENQESQKRFEPLDSSASPLSTAPIQKVPEMLEQIESFQGKLDQRQKDLDAL